MFNLDYASVSLPYRCGQLGDYNGQHYIDAWLLKNMGTFLRIKFTIISQSQIKRIKKFRSALFLLNRVRQKCARTLL